MLTNAKKLAERVDGLVLLIHHAGKELAKGMRGHSSLNAAMDAVILVAKDKDRRYLSVTKAKDDAEASDLDFELISHAVGQDEEGLDITSCAVRQTIHTPAITATEKPPTGKNQITALAKAKELLVGAPDGVSFDEVVEAVAGVLKCESRRRKTVATDTVNSLMKSRHLASNEGIATHPPVSKVRPYAMVEIERAVGSQGRFLSPVLMALGWTRKRVWRGGGGPYSRCWLPPNASDQAIPTG